MSAGGANPVWSERDKVSGGSLQCFLLYDREFPGRLKLDVASLDAIAGTVAQQSLR